MNRSLQGILTTHAGSLFRPPDLLEMLTARVLDQPIDADEYLRQLRLAVDDVVAKQAECGIDILNDGEQSKHMFSDYIAHRVYGFEGENPDLVFANRRLDYPEYYVGRSAASGDRRPLCVGPLSWKDPDAVTVDIENLKAAMGKVQAQEGFITAPSPGIVAMRMPNAYYPSDEDYLVALAELLRDEYRAIVDAGLLLQIDAPDIPMSWDIEFGADDFENYRRSVLQRNEVLNYALTGIPEESVRYHVCWGNSETPHTLDIDLHRIVDLVLDVHAQAYSIEAANPRHAHEWELWRDVRLPDGKILIPGVIDSTTNYVEHPELVAQRIIQYADLVGRENVIASTDCGFGTAARLEPRVHPVVMWAKLKTMTEGAELASRRLWK